MQGHCAQRLASFALGLSLAAISLVYTASLGIGVALAVCRILLAG